jgi:hypothetical protein
MANRYDISFKNQVEDDIQILIEPRQEYDLLGNPIPVESTIYLNAVAGSFRLSSGFNDDDKTYCGILTKELQFGYVYNTVNDVSIETFMTDDFDYWKVTCRVNQGIIFQGYLAMEASQRLMNRSEDVILKAVDGLGFLKAATAYEGVGKNTPLFYFVQLLGQLNLPDIKLRTLFNVTHTTMTGRTSDPTYDPLDNILIEDKLFVGLDGYAAMNLLLTDFKCRLYQEGGFWWLEHIGERLNIQPFGWSEYSIAEGEEDGDPYEYTHVESQIVQDVRCLIGHDKSVKLVNADAIKYVQLPKRFVKLTYNYQMPAELFCQQSPDEGHLVNTIIYEGTEENPDPNAFDDVVKVEYYYLNCWEYIEGDVITGATVPFIRASWVIGYDADNNEIDRYISLPQLGDPGEYKLKSELFEVTVGDKIEISLERKTIAPFDNSDADDQIAMFVLYGDDSNTYFLQMDGSWDTVQEVLTSRYDIEPGVNEYFRGTWKPITFTRSQRAPVSGQAQLVLIEASYLDIPFGLSMESNFKNIKLDINFSVNNLSIGYAGDYNKQSEPTKAVDSIEKEVKISDWVNQNVLGALYKLEFPREPYYPQWSYYGEFITFRRFTSLMSAVLHSHTRRSLIKIETSFKAYSFLYGTTPYQVGFLPRYQFTDFSTIKEFMMTGAYDIDLTSGIGRAVFVETLADKTDGEFGESTNYEFQYIAE